MRLTYFRHAREAMLKSDYTCRGSTPKLGAVAVYKGAIIAEAWNTNRTSTLQNKYNRFRYSSAELPAKTHCETMLIQKIRWKFGDELEWGKVQIYLYREHKDGSLAESSPCASCRRMLLDHGITHIYHTSEWGYVEEYLVKEVKK